ncbi:hypothetical protein ACQ10R_15075, partial [Enterococcus faecalis]
YPPIAKAIDLPSLLVSDAPDGAQAASTSDQEADELRIQETPAATPTNGIEDESAALFGRGLISTMFAFLGFGILLSLTPCVFPMIPI